MGVRQERLGTTSVAEIDANAVLAKSLVEHSPREIRAVRNFEVTRHASPEHASCGELNGCASHQTDRPWRSQSLRGANAHGLTAGCRSCRERRHVKGGWALIRNHVVDQRCRY